MTTTTLHPLPASAAVFIEQIRATGLAIRREAAVAGGLLLAVMLVVLTSHLLGGGARFDFNVSELSVPAVTLGFFLPLAIWKSEEPSRRAYLWTLPVARSRVTLAKVLGGWLWYMGLVAGYLAWGVALALLTGGLVGVEETRMLVGGVIEGIRPDAADFFVHRVESPPWMWLVPFAGATVTYLFGSALVLTSDHPWLWYGGLVFTYLLLVALAQAGQAGELGRVLASVTDGRYGLEVLLSGVANQEATVSAPSGRVGTLVVDVPILGRWATATAIWGSVSLAALLGAAFRYQER
jgi:hypothetical protein